MAKEYTNGFYKSNAWKKLSRLYMTSKNYVCERCGGVGAICHHKKYITPNNINDINITLNLDNLECLCMACHNLEHGLKNNLTYFDENGQIERVKEKKELQEYNKEKQKIDKLLNTLKHE